MSGGEAQSVITIEAGFSSPYSPQDAGHFIGQGDGRFVVTDALFSTDSPAFDMGQLTVGFCLSFCCE